MPDGWTIHDPGDGPVRFTIGMRWRHLWRLAWRPWVAVAFARMLRAAPETGLERSRLRVRRGGPVVVQRWRSRSELDRWAHRDAAHAAPWSRFRREAGSTAAWGVWHEVGPAQRALRRTRTRAGAAGPRRSPRADAS